MTVNIPSTYPSRHSNPFATCWTKPGAIPYQFASGECVDSLVARLVAANWRGAIVGPHGAGKSTLLATLLPSLQAAGRGVSVASLRDAERRLPPDFVRNALAPPRPLIVVDGYEQLSCLSRWSIAWKCRRAGAGLLVTSHRPTRFPTLIELKPDLRQVLELVSQLTRRNATAVTPDDVAASHACHGENVREILFDLYDRHERARRAVRTTAPWLA